MVSSDNNENKLKGQKLRYLRAFIVLVAGLFMMICDFSTGQSLTVSLIHLLLVLIAFWILANIVVWCIKKALEMPTKEQLEAAELALAQAENPEEEEEQGGQPDVGEI